MNDWIVSKSGRRFKRNSENTGTIMEWNNNGTVRNTIIYDAKYRSKKPFYSNNNINLNLPKIHNFEDNIFNWTDSIFNQSDVSNKDKRTNHDATQAIVNFDNKDDNAANYVRSLTNLNSNGCDLPTINCLCRIYADHEILDSMDPTVEIYNEYSLTNWFRYWSSSWYGKNKYNNMYKYHYYAFEINDNGYISVIDQNLELNVCPVLDIDIKEEK